mmetsp:Transcript_30796/g.35058  ORF Transcript_30796/g.35058 Transcript_30796/m.35058 type:complete len:117 (+) Transcript_30796:1525-1875(+)
MPLKRLERPSYLIRSMKEDPTPKIRKTSIEIVFSPDPPVSSFLVFAFDEVKSDQIQKFHINKEKGKQKKKEKEKKKVHEPTKPKKKSDVVLVALYLFVTFPFVFDIQFSLSLSKSS